MANVIDILINMTKNGSGAEDAGTALDDVATSAGDTGMALLGSVLGFTTVTGAALALVEGLKADVDAASELETASSRMDMTIQSTGRSAELGAGQLEQMAAAEEGLFSRTDIENAANKLMTYMEIPSSQIPGDLALLQNMAAAMGGTVTDAATTLGNALETGRVRGMGFSTELTKELSLLASHGQIAEMDSIILDELSLKYSGQAATALDTYAGKTAELNTAMDDLKVTIGNGLTPIIEADDEEITSLVGDVTNWLNSLAEQKTYNEQLIATEEQLKQQYEQQHGLSVQGVQDSQFEAQAVSELANRKKDAAFEATAMTQMQAAAQQQLTDAMNATAAAAAQEQAGDTFLDSAVKSLSASDASIKTIEDEITAARAAGYSASGSKILGYENQIEDLKTKENTAMLQMAANWVYTEDVMTGKMDMTQFLAMETHMGLITKGEQDAALAWLAYAKTVASNPVYGSVVIGTTYQTVSGQGKDSSALPAISKTTGPGGIVSSTDQSLINEFAHPQAAGGDYMVNQPTLFLAGEAGPERATFTPQGGSGANGGITINVSGAGDPRRVADEVASRLMSQLNMQGVRTRQ